MTDTDPTLDATAWISALRNSHDRFTALVAPLRPDQVEAPSYASEWSIADTASHLGSQAEIFDRFLTAGLTGAPAPGNEVFGPIWDRWNSRPPAEQTTESVAATEAFVARLEYLTDDERAAFALEAFGRQLDLAGLAALRLGEHALHTWDVAVAFDPGATVSADAVGLLLTTLPQTAVRAGKPNSELAPVVIETVEPTRRFRLTAAPEVSLTPEFSDGETAERAVELPAEALIRLVFGRLDPDHTPDGVGDDRLDALRAVFPGF
jgi:uncharacterized protein (TIGR03083 family)